MCFYLYTTLLVYENVNETRPRKTLYHFMKKDIAVFCQFDVTWTRYQPEIDVKQYETILYQYNMKTKQENNVKYDTDQTPSKSALESGFHIFLWDHS